MYLWGGMYSALRKRKSDIWDITLDTQAMHSHHLANQMKSHLAITYSQINRTQFTGDCSTVAAEEGDAHSIWIISPLIYVTVQCSIDFPHILQAY